MWCVRSLIALIVMTQVSAVTVSRTEITSSGQCSTHSWANWSPCPVSCGLGKQRRARIYEQTTNNGRKCMLEAEMKQCYSNPCQPPESVRCPSPWGAWTECSVTCGTGNRLRFRNSYPNGQGICFKISHSIPCHQQPCKVKQTVRQNCKEVEDVTSAVPALPMQLFLPADIPLHRCAHLFYTIIAPTSYGVELNVSLTSHFKQNSGTTIQVMEQTTASTDTHNVLYKGALNTSRYQTKLNTMLVQIDIKNAPQFFGVTLSCGAYKVAAQKQYKVPGCPHPCFLHVQTFLTGTRGILSLPERYHHCITMVWVMKPLPVLSSLLAKGTDLQQQQIVFGSSLSFQFPQGILPETDYMEVKDGESDSVPVYKGRTFPLQLITSGSNARLTLQMCNISLYRNFRISYQQVLRQKVQVELPTMHHQATLTPTPIVTAVETVKPTTSESKKKPRKRCPVPPLVQNAVFRSKMYVVGQRVTYLCKPGYELLGDKVLKCKDKGDVMGQWNKSPPRCQESCNVTEWSEWTSCLMGCVKGSQNRLRVQSVDGNCKAEQQTRPCSIIQPCPAPELVWPCGWNIRVKTKGRLSSPGYPHGYLSNQECIWKISVALGQEIELLFSEISTEELFDIVEVRDGGDSNSPLLGEFSGQINATRIQSTSNKLYIRLLTDGSSEGKGFQAQLQAIGMLH